MPLPAITTPPSFGLEQIDALLVLGMRIRISNQQRGLEKSISPCLLCMSAEAREDVRLMAREESVKLSHAADLLRLKYYTEVVGLGILEYASANPLSIFRLSSMGIEEVEKIGNRVIEEYRAYEAELKAAREDEKNPNPRAFFTG